MSSTEQPQFPADVDPDIGKGPAISLDELMSRVVQSGARQALVLFCEEALAVGVTAETINEILDRVAARKAEIKQQMDQMPDALSRLVTEKGNANGA